MPILEKAPPRRRRPPGDFFAVLLLLAVAGGLAGLWWHSKKQPPPPPRVLNAQPEFTNGVGTARCVVPVAVQATESDSRDARFGTPVPPALRAGTAQRALPTNSGLSDFGIRVQPAQSDTLPAAASLPATNPVTVALAPSAAGFPRPARDGLEVQVALARRGISPGSLDGAVGSQTRAALAAFQREEKLPETASLNPDTRLQLTLEAPVLTEYTVTSSDLARLQPLGKTWQAKAAQSALEYETLLELVAETAHAYPALIQKLNPEVCWTNVSPGTVLKIPQADYPEVVDRAAFVVIHLSGKYLEAFDAETNLLLHCPCSIAARVEKRPVGELHVSVVAPHPNYTFDPAVFPESPEAQAVGHKLILPPGPNNPVGVAWIGLDKPGYGMHGTPSPEQVGRTESHGCFRLANWDAAYLLKLARIGLRVEVLP